MIVLDLVKVPEEEQNLRPVMLEDATIAKRKAAVLEKMAEAGLDALVVYGDLEHGSNFEYLTGFLPRFEEALCIVKADGQAVLVLGNENLNKASKARLACRAVHMPHLSLPNQPMETNKTVPEILAEAGLESCKRIGIAGWKHFTSKQEDNAHLFDLPYFLMEGLKQTYPQAKFVNASSILIGNNGVRTQNNANEFAHYEYGAALAGNRMLKAVQALEPGKTELEIGALMHGDGQHHSVVTIMASGPRFVKANLYPTEHEITLGEPLSMTVGYKGGLQSHSGFAARDENDLPENQKDYVEQSAKPYYQAVVTWLETIKPGITGKQLYDAVNEVLPKEKYHWTLNPGHLCADEEWLSSPVYPDSEEVLKSGMLFQIDILPSVKGYNSANCESGIFLADEQLRKEIEKQYPDVWERVQNRRAWMQEELGIQLDASVLPTSCITAWLPPYLLDPARAMKQK